MTMSKTTGHSEGTDRYKRRQTDKGLNGHWKSIAIALITVPIGVGGWIINDMDDRIQTFEDRVITELTAIRDKQDVGLERMTENKGRLDALERTVYNPQ